MTAPPPPPAPSRSAQAGQLTALDLIGVVAALLPAAVAFLFPILIAPRFARMFQDFGGTLPVLTKFALQPVSPILLAMIPVAGVVASVAMQDAALGIRRALIAGAFLLGLLACGALVLAMYLPIFELAGSIK